ncbi:hypothetical protein L1047_10915 [Synechococcus sp. Nb3U1]|uniref:hypothetical protein n=1 Tax=Synechococcus sp. Nb3U1 TaxID=1914529 RepID=UPI001F31CE13|nr:hypothetical protein [Synechococcus sp. Nb3U1]MCF2971704.1 hypothetical protein [Synechococcus sp. Nb3U1]
MALTLISSQQQILPSMYDLPSEYPEDPGLPDEFHLWQPQSKTYPPEQVFTASDLNLDYDSQRTHLYKRPDWFAVVGVPPLLDHGRLSYVVWQEGRSLIVVVEWLSPRTIEVDQGRDQQDGSRRQNKKRTSEQSRLSNRQHGWQNSCRHWGWRIPRA